jgi:hypothetical protein
LKANKRERARLLWRCCKSGPSCSAVVGRRFQIVPPPFSSQQQDHLGYFYLQPEVPVKGGQDDLAELQRPPVRASYGTSKESGKIKKKD